MDESCESCVFGKITRENLTPVHMLCRRYPPGVAANEMGYGSDWPRVAPSEWCGEYQRLLTDEQMDEVVAEIKAAYPIPGETNNG